jgi:heme/copper-type cytochrome/quinol oxidase subunit 1
MGMESFVRNFIRSSLVWFGVGVLLGLSMAWWPADHLVYRPAHAHANLLGFVSMMIFGVAYHIIPRFSGAPLQSRRLALVHLWLANLGLTGLVGGWIARVWVGSLGNLLINVGAGLSTLGAFCFIYNIWRTLGPVRTPRAAKAGAGTGRRVNGTAIGAAAGAPAGVVAGNRNGSPDRVASRPR